MFEMTTGPDSVVLVREGKEVTREQFRQEVLDQLPANYSPVLHLVFPSVVGVLAIAVSLAMLHRPDTLDWYFVPLVLMMSNAVEWRAHKHVLHKRTKPFELLYDRHTPVHHRVYMTDDMAIRSRREFGLVLIPPYGILLILAVTVPIAGLLWWAHQTNLACLFVATTTFYVVSYEWLHLAYHLPTDSFIGRMRLIQKLRRHHALHHDPRLMQRWNFNVTLPLWDWVRGTTYRGQDK
jgi:Fatty acid hydroxylase superfamily